MPKVIKARYKLRSGTTTEWATYDEVLASAEVGEEVTPTGERLRKVGDGTSKWSQLPYRVNDTVDRSTAPTDGQTLAYNSTTGLLEWRDAGKTYQAGRNIVIDNPASATPTINSDAGLQINNRVDTYGDLPSPPAEGTGATYLVEADGLLYVWDGSAWPAQGEGESSQGSGHLIGTGLVLNTDTNIVRVSQTGDIQIDITWITRPQGQSGTYQLRSSGGTGPNAWTVDTLPTGMTMSTAGLITDAGTASAGDTTSVFAVSDANNDKVNRAFVVRVTTGDPYWSSVVALLHFDTSLTLDATGRSWSTNGSPETVAGKFSSAMQTTNGCVSTPSTAALALGNGDFTLEAWLKLLSSEAQGYNGLFGKRSSSISNASFALTTKNADKEWIFEWSTTGSDKTSCSWSLNNSIVGSFIHMAMVRHSNQLKLYVDGVEQPYLAGSDGIITDTIYNSSHTLDIGSVSNASHLDGVIDDARVTVGVARYTTNFTPPDRPFIDF